MKCKECVKFIEDYSQCEITCEKVIGDDDCSLSEMAERLFIKEDWLKPGGLQGTPAPRMKPFCIKKKQL